MGSSQVEVSPTLLEYFSQLTQVDRLTEPLPIPTVRPEYVYVLFFIFLEVAVIGTYAHLTGGTHGLVHDPFFVALYLGLVVAVVGTRYMHRGHVDAMEVLIERGICDLEHADDYTVSLRMRFLFYIIGLIVFFSSQIFVVGIDTIVQNQGIPGIAFTLVLLPGCYLPVAIDFVSEYTTLHIFIPRWLRGQEVGLFFFDPQNMGGYRPLGSLLKNSYYFYTGSLLLYLAFFYGNFITPLRGGVVRPPGAPEAVMFTVLWLFGLATLSYSMYKIHRIMKSEREAQLRAIEREIQELIENPHNITEAEITDQDRLDALEYRLGQIQATSEYPTTFTMWTQIGISVLLPQILQLALQATV